MAALACLLALVSGPPAAPAAGIVEAELNGLALQFDADTGGILKMSYPGVGAMIDTQTKEAGILDLAYPIKAFEPLRLAPRFSTGAKIEKTADAVTITWDKLGSSRTRTASSKVQQAVNLQYNESDRRYDWRPLTNNPFDLQGKVSASVTFKAAPDGRSILLTCSVDNQSDLTVPQVLFPDFSGIIPFEGDVNTLFRTCGFASQPFVEMRIDPNVGISYYSVDARFCGVEYASGSYFGSSPMVAKWMDIGGLKGGFSLFRQRWNWGPKEDMSNYQEKVWVRLSEVTGRLRVACTHASGIKPGQKWQSEPYVLTPHQHGWAKGIEPYRQFVKENLRRPYPLAKHVREGIGFRTVYMTEAYPNDPDGDYTFKCSDLPKVAQECKDHGIDEMCLWAWNWNLQVPVTRPFPQIGTEEDMRQAVEACKKIGVNVNLFISLMAVANPTAERYGLQVPPPSEGWTYHAEFVPMMRPFYGSGLSCAYLPTTDPRWQEGVLRACKHLCDAMTPSIGWDQFGGYPSEPGLYTLVDQLQAYAKAKDPEATFNGESISNVDTDAIYLDYTWNWNYWPWRGGGDCRPLNSVYPSPRPNANIDRSPREARGAFVDNMYLNVFPSKKGGINGSGLIADYPPLSRALKQCARLRKQFLPYFLDGTIIGDCLLTELRHQVRLNTYILPDKALVVLMNDSADGTVEFKADLAPWLKSPSGSYEIKTYDTEGQLLRTTKTSALWLEKTPEVKATELAVYEIRPI